MAKRKLKIGVILQSPDMGGAETLIYLLIKDFNKHGNTIFLVTNNNILATKCAVYIKERINIPLILDFIGNLKGLIKSILFLPYLLFFYLRLLSRFRRLNIDVLLISGFSEKLVVSFLSLIIKIPVVWIEHGPLSTILPKNLGFPGLLYKYACKIPKKIIVPSRLTYKSLVDYVRIPKTQVKLIYLGVYIRPSISSVSEKNEAPRTYVRGIFSSFGAKSSEAEGKYSSTISRPWSSAKEDKLIIGNVSRLAKEKGQEYLIKAMPKILEQIPNARLILVGDGPARNYYQKLVTDLSINKYVEMTGYVNDVNIFYSKFDIFVFPTVWELEGFGLVMVEAMARKIPVVASKIGPVPEIVDDGKSGFLVDPKNPNQLSERILELALSENMRVKFGNNGYNRAKDMFDIKNTVSYYEDILRSSI